MSRRPAKRDFPVSRVRRYLEPGPTGDGVFMVAGEIIDRRALFKPAMLG